MGVAERADYYFNTTLLRNVRDVQTTDRSDESQEIPSISGRGEPVGWTHPPKRGKNVSFTTTPLKGVGFEQPWQQLKRDKTEFVWQRVTDFETLILRRVVVQTTEEGTGDNGELTLTVTLSSLQEQPIT